MASNWARARRKLHRRRRAKRLRRRAVDASMAVNVIKVERRPLNLRGLRAYFAILIGIGVAARHFMRNLLGFARGIQDFTIHYPEQRLLHPPALRGMPVLVQMENGKERCVACGL